MYVYIYIYICMYIYIGRVMSSEIGSASVAPTSAYVSIREAQCDYR